MIFFFFFHLNEETQTHGSHHHLRCHTLTIAILATLDHHSLCSANRILAHHRPSLPPFCYYNLQPKLLFIATMSFVKPLQSLPYLMLNHPRGSTTSLLSPHCRSNQPPFAIITSHHSPSLPPNSRPVFLVPPAHISSPIVTQPFSLLSCFIF